MLVLPLFASNRICSNQRGRERNASHKAYLLRLKVIIFIQSLTKFQTGKRIQVCSRLALKILYLTCLILKMFRAGGTKRNLQWNVDLTKYQGTGEICSLYQGFVISRFSI